MYSVFLMDLVVHDFESRDTTLQLHCLIAGNLLNQSLITFYIYVNWKQAVQNSVQAVTVIWFRENSVI